MNLNLEGREYRCIDMGDGEIVFYENPILKIKDIAYWLTDGDNLIVGTVNKLHFIPLVSIDRFMMPTSYIVTRGD